MVVAALFQYLNKNKKNNNKNKESLPGMKNYIMIHNHPEPDSPLKLSMDNKAIQRPFNFERKILYLIWKNKINENYGVK